jgi:hypothetical protein
VQLACHLREAVGYYDVGSFYGCAEVPLEITGEDNDECVRPS